MEMAIVLPLVMLLALVYGKCNFSPTSGFRTRLRCTGFPCTFDQLKDVNGSRAFTPFLHYPEQNYSIDRKNKSVTN